MWVLCWLVLHVDMASACKIYLKSVIINMVALEDFEVISDKFIGDRTYV
jgi:hypothetical protein